MINKKTKIIIVSIMIILVIVLIVINKKKKATKNDNITSNSDNSRVIYDKNEKLYYLIDKDTNEVIMSSEYEDSFLIYEENPDYDPNPTFSNDKNIVDFGDEDEIETDIIE